MLSSLLKMLSVLHFYKYILNFQIKIGSFVHHLKFNQFDNMKKFIPIFILTLITTLSYAQVLEITPNPVLMDFNGLDLSNNDLEEVGHYTIKNITDDPISLRWVHEISPDCNANWTFPVCDNNSCYDESISSNVNSSFNIPAMLGAGEESTLFSLHVKPKGAAGCCTVKLHFYSMTDFNTIIETIDFDVRINDSECELVSVSEETAAALRIFPNPITDYFQIEGNHNQDVKSLVVYNLLGRKVRAFDAVNNTRFDMSGLPQGIYLVSMMDQEGGVIKTTRISRQIAMP